MYDPYFFVFNDAKIQEEFDDYLSQKPIDAGVLKGQLIYNILACPYIICYHYHYHLILKRPSQRCSLIFFLTVILIHVCFFTYYILEPTDSSQMMNENQKKLNGKRRMLAIDCFFILQLVACGLVMHAHLPLVAYTGFCRFDDGELALEPFIISCFLNIYHHNLYPVHWWVIMITLFLHFLLIIFSWRDEGTQNMIQFQSTVILSLFYVAMLICNYRIHNAKIVEFLLTESFSMNLSSSKSSPPTLRPLSDRNEKTSSITTVEGVIGSSSSMEGNNAIPSGSITRVSRIHHRRQHHRKSESDSSIQLEETNSATPSTLPDGHTSTLPERRKPHRLLAKERPLY